MTLPRFLRNRLAEVILDSFHDPEARRGLQAVAAVCADPEAVARIVDLPQRALRDCFEEHDGGLQLRNGWREYAADLRERSRRAWQAIGKRPLDPPDAPLELALGAAAALFDAGLYYEVHEWLEPYWRRAEGSDREALQGLIQVAAGFEHLVNGNVSGARTLLTDGSAKMLGRRIHGLDLNAFARAVRACLDRGIAQGATGFREFDWVAVPRFPTGPAF